MFSGVGYTYIVFMFGFDRYVKNKPMAKDIINVGK
jgi:hypothetical protein